MTDILRGSRNLPAFVTPSSHSSLIDCGMQNTQEEWIPSYLPKNLWGLVSTKGVEEIKCMEINFPEVQN